MAKICRNDGGDMTEDRSINQPPFEWTCTKCGRRVLEEMIGFYHEENDPTGTVYPGKMVMSDEYRQWLRRRRPEPYPEDNKVTEVI